MKTRILSIAIVLHLFGALPARSDGIQPDALDALKTFAVAHQAALSQLASFEMKATLDITVHPSATTPEKHHWNITVIGKGDKLKETEDGADDSPGAMYLEWQRGNNTSPTTPVPVTRIYYLSSNTVIEADIYPGEKTAKKLAMGPPDVGLDNCPAFFEDSFLYSSVPDLGVPALLPSVLSSNDTWLGMIQRAHTIKFERNGILHVESADDKGSSYVNFVKSTGSNGGYQVRDIGFFHTREQNRIPDRTIEVLDYVHDKTFGDIGRKFRMELLPYAFGWPHPFEPVHPDCIFDFAITEIKINPPIDNASLEFDPASVTDFYDDQKGWTEVNNIHK